MDRSAVLVHVAALGIFCVLTDICVHSNRMYKIETQTCQEEEGGSFQTNVPFGSVTTILPWLSAPVALVWWFYCCHQGSLIAGADLWKAWVILDVSMFISVCNLQRSSNDSFPRPPTQHIQVISGLCCLHQSFHLKKKKNECHHVCWNNTIIILHLLCMAIYI